MRKAVIFLTFGLLAAAFACCCVSGKNTEKRNVSLGAREKAVLTQAEEIPFFKEARRNAAKYELEEQCLLGAYILSDNYANRDISCFEKITKVKHGFYMYTMKADGEFPDEWVLECKKQNKMPFIVIIPPEKDAFNLTNISDISKKLGEYDVPSFVGIYPNPSSITDNPEEFINFFEGCGRFFDLNSKSTALVWLCGEKFSENAAYFCERADWAGIYLYEKINNDNLDISKESFEAFYNEYQGRLPLMAITGVSHYSMDTCKYYVAQTQEEITEFYESLKNEYPCLKAVCYMDFDGCRLEKASDNFLLTDTDGVLFSYMSAVNNPYFISDAKMQGGEITLKVKQSFCLMKQGEKIYFPIKYCFENYSQYDIIFIYGEKYIPYEDLNEV